MERALIVSLAPWPGLAARVPADPPGVADVAAFVRAREASWRVVAARPDLAYEDAVARGEIPTRERSWHDVLNVLAFVRFPRAKLALHRRVLALRRTRLQAEAPTRGRRSREEDALTLLDECALLVGGTARALARLADARKTRDLETIDAVMRTEPLHVACFGHALLEHLVLARPPIGAGLVPLEIDAPAATTLDPALDQALAEAVDHGTFEAPRLAPTVPWPDPIVDGWFREASRNSRET